MALSLDCDLQVNKVQTWKVHVPFENQVRQSSNFSLIGSEWCLRFSYKVTGPIFNATDNNGRSYETRTGFHVITLHRVIDGQVSIDTVAVCHQGHLKKKFILKTCLMQPTDGRSENKGVTHSQVEKNSTRIWYAGVNKDDIFKIFPSLYDCFEVTVVCMFYGLPMSGIQLDVETDRSTTLKTVKTDLECLSRDFGRLMDDGHLNDLTLKCGIQVFRAHRFVLAARSPVFADLFRNRREEINSGAVLIEGADPYTLRHFLQYMYSGELTAGSGDTVASLFALAERYDVDSLKGACARWIAGRLTEVNCLEYLAVGDRCGSEALKKEAIACACAHPKVMLREEWSEFSIKNPKLALEVHQSYVRFKNPGYLFPIPEIIKKKVPPSPIPTSDNTKKL